MISVTTSIVSFSSASIASPLLAGASAVAATLSHPFFFPSRYQILPIINANSAALNHHDAANNKNGRTNPAAAKL